jgi:hypothetical protein
MGMDDDRNRSKLRNESTAGYLGRGDVVDCAEGAAVVMIPGEFGGNVVCVFLFQKNEWFA